MLFTPVWECTSEMGTKWLWTICSAQFSPWSLKLSVCVCIYSERFLSYIYASTRKWTRFKSKYSSYMYLFLWKGTHAIEGNTAFLTTGVGDSVCQQLSLQLLHTHFSIRSQKNKNVHTCLGFSLLLAHCLPNTTHSSFPIFTIIYNKYSFFNSHYHWQAKLVYAVF